MIHPEPGRCPEESLRRWAGSLLAGSRPSRPLAAGVNLTRDFLRSHGIEPSLVEKARTDPTLKRALPDESSLEHCVAVEMARQTEFISVIRALQAQCPSHPPVFLKGQALAYVLYPQPWLRSRSDIDALVPRDSIHAITNVLRTRGYRPANAIDGDLVLRQMSLAKRQYGIDHIWDVHWSISNRPAFQDLLSYKHLLDTGTPVTVEDVTFMVPNTVSNLLIACLHLVGHHAHDVRLVWLYDMHLLAERMSESQKQEFLDLAGGRPEIGAACHAALSLTGKYLLSQATAGLERALDPGPKHRLRLKRFYVARLFEDARAMDRTNRYRFARQHLFPSAAYMKERFGLKYSWQVPVWYVVRIGRAIPKLFRRR